MALIHEFGFMESIDKDKNYISYEPEKYRCISVHDDYILPVLNDLSILKTYWNSLSRPNLGLAYYGITLIPPESQPLFQDILLSSRNKQYFSDLLGMCLQAAEENNYMIHYGI